MKIVNLVVAIWRLVARYPAVTAGVFQVIILAGTQIGLHLTTGQLTTLAGTIAAVFAVLVHAGVIPVTKVDNVKAGLKPDVPTGVVVAGERVNEMPAEPSEPVSYTPTVPTSAMPSPSTSEADKTHADEPPREVVHEAITTIEAKPAPDASRLGKPISPNRKAK